MTSLKQVQLEAIALMLSRFRYRVIESFLPDMWEIEGEYTTTLCYLQSPSEEDTNTFDRNWVLGPCVESASSIREYHHIRSVVTTELARVRETAKEVGLDAD